jgi:hypothetical protein
MLRNFISLKNPLLMAGFEPVNLESSGKYDSHYTIKNDWLRRLGTGLSLWRSRFVPGSIHVGFVVDKAALE